MLRRHGRGRTRVVQFVRPTRRSSDSKCERCDADFDAASRIQRLCAAWAVSSPYHVSQKGRAFQPGELSILRGETVQIVNDDGDLLHHAYLESDRFSFDSGDQEPGSKTDVVFPVSGTFTILCGIHPKMKLLVRVK
jgi:plastocyanin